jgi:hypothetical protein
MIAEVSVGGIEQEVDNIPVGRRPVDVDVLRGPGDVGKPQLQGEATLEHPFAGRDKVQTGEEALERNPLPQTSEESGIGRTASLGCIGSQALLERSPKGLRTGVLHALPARALLSRF